MHGHQFDRGHTQTAEMVDGRRACQPRVSASNGWVDAGELFRETFYMKLVDDGVLPGRRGGPVVAPVKLPISDHGSWHGWCAVGVIPRKVCRRIPEPIGEQRLAPLKAALDRSYVTVQNESGRIAPQ